MLVALGIAAFPATAGAAPRGEVAGATITGCRGELTSVDSSGDVIDRAVGEPPHQITDPDDQKPTFTRDHPFTVTSDGAVEWSGETTTAITDQTGELTVWGITVADNRTANDELARAGDGTVDVGSLLPFDVTGLVKFEGSLEGQGGECLASGWVEVDGNPILTVAGFAALLLTGAGLGLVIAAQPRQRPARTSP
jgi:hypothetical protein